MYFGFIMLLGVSLSIALWSSLVMWLENRLLSLALFYLTVIGVVEIAAVNGLRDIQIGAFLSLSALTHLGVLGVLVFYYTPICYYIVISWLRKNRVKESAFEPNYHMFDKEASDSLDDL